MDVNSRGCDFSKEAFSLSTVGLAGNVDSLEDDDTGLDDVFLDSESKLWSDGIEISSSAAWTRYYYLSASFLCSWSCNPSLVLFIIFIISEVSNPKLLSGWNLRAMEL